MIIKTDSEGKQAIMVLVDAIFKGSGVAAYKELTEIMNAIEVTEEPEKEEIQEGE